MGFLIQEDKYYRHYHDRPFGPKKDWTGYELNYQGGQYKFRIIEEIDSFIIHFTGVCDKYFDLTPLQWSLTQGRGHGYCTRIEYKDHRHKWQAIHKVEAFQCAMTQMVKIIMKKKNKQNQIFLTRSQLIDPIRNIYTSESKSEAFTRLTRTGFVRFNEVNGKRCFHVDPSKKEIVQQIIDMNPLELIQSEYIPSDH